MTGARGARVVIGTSATTHRVVGFGVAFLASAIAYAHLYLPNYSSSAVAARERADVAADAQIEQERPISKGSVRSNMKAKLSRAEER